MTQTNAIQICLAASRMMVYLSQFPFAIKAWASRLITERSLDAPAGR